MGRSRRGVGGTLFWVLSLLVVLSMICGTLLIVLPGPQRRVRPTATPTLAAPLPSPTTVAPTPTAAAAPSPQPQPTS
ncbi:MAG: hypothetical protein JSW37_13225 [Anaerolineales bacterium]|nr:MAG: hypothetical protein JSW37_13225 [Anaerolineales bacterium]